MFTIVFLILCLSKTKVLNELMTIMFILKSYFDEFLINDFRIKNLNKTKIISINYNYEFNLENIKKNHKQL